jgi:hypothetical protein
LYGYKNFVSRSKEEHRFKVFENRMLRKIFEPKRQKKDAGDNII